MRSLTLSLVAMLLGVTAIAQSGNELRVPRESGGEIDLVQVVATLGRACGVHVAKVEGTLALPLSGVPGALTRSLLAESLGPDFVIAIDRDALRVRILGPIDAEATRRRVSTLARRVEQELRRSRSYGFHALPSYRPNDPRRPTIVLLHGINSSSGSFVHMVAPLETAGFGVIVHDFAFNRDLRESVAQFTRDWKAFRAGQKEEQAWSVLTHSMGGLVARGYVEGADYGNDVDHLFLIGPPNHGSALAKAQTLLQFIQGLQSVKGQEGDALAQLSEGLGEAADDMVPGSAFLKELNARPRRDGVRYHILTGDAGFLTREARARIEAQYATFTNRPGLLGTLTRVATRDLKAQLDEMTDGLGDGCVSVESAALDGVKDLVTIHANHVELIRGPLLFPTPGPVVAMPFVLERLREPEGRPIGGK